MTQTTQSSLVALDSCKCCRQLPRARLGPMPPDATTWLVGEQKQASLL